MDFSKIKPLCLNFSLKVAPISSILEIITSWQSVAERLAWGAQNVFNFGGNLSIHKGFYTIKSPTNSKLFLFH